MKSRLNFNRLLFTSILAFVSFQNTGMAASQTSGQEQDDFAIFEEKPTGKAKPVEKPKEKKPDPISESAEQKIERLKTEIRKNPRNVALIVQLAEIFYQKKEYEKTTALLWKQIDKIDRPAILLLARAEEEQKQPNDMIRALNNLVGKDEKDYEAYALLGNAYHMQKKYSEALENYKKSLDVNSKYEPAYQSLLSMYEKRTPPNLYEMRILVQDMIDNIGNRAEYLAKLCEINFNDSTFEAAIETCKQAISKDAKSANSYVNLGLSYKEIGEEETSAKTLKKAANDFPKSEYAQYSYGKILENQKNNVEAMKYFKAGTDADGTSARSWLGLASASFDMKKYEVALIAYKNACKFDKKNAVAFRRATTVLRNSRNSEWSGKFESASENCTF